MKFIDFFAGCGGFRMGLEQAGHECVGFVEIDKFAQKSYRAIFNTSEEWFHDDVTTINSKEIPQADIWTFGFPCQDISIAGNRKGFEGERSSLFFAVTKLLRELAQKEETANQLPTYLIAENVKGFLYVNGGWDFLVAITELDEIGYDVEWELLNSKDFGVPQHRERVYLIGHLRGRDTRKVFPLARESSAVGLQRVGILPYIKYRANQRVYCPSGLTPTMTTKPGCSYFFFGDRKEGLNNADAKERNTFEILSLLQQKIGEKEIAEWRFRILDSLQKKEILRQKMYGGSFQAERKNGKPELVCGTRKSETNQEREQMRKMWDNEKYRCTPQGQELAKQFAREFAVIMQELSFEGTSTEKIMQDLWETTKGIRLLQQALHQIQEIWRSVVYEKSSFRIRKLTPRETWRLQGFPDWAFDRAKTAGVSDNQLYKRAGNAVTVNVAKAIGEKLVTPKVIT